MVPENIRLHWFQEGATYEYFNLVSDEDAKHLNVEANKQYTFARDAYSPYHGRISYNFGYTPQGQAQNLDVNADKLPDWDCHFKLLRAAPGNEK